MAEIATYSKTGLHKQSWYLKEPYGLYVPPSQRNPKNLILRLFHNKPPFLLYYEAEDINDNNVYKSYEIRVDSAHPVDSVPFPTDGG
ncbi:hypothetical protein kac65v162_gp139 [Nodularia phage vB_NspS-kac65v162]|uniref:Uncharacterized protein n=3 Tax=Ravarandavirus kac65v151 TaxID=2845689 RepID=A0A482MHD7_9CAUD|nr:hypothetical protein HWC12_gp178 [Nodularia phage vB_NspS-kac65v151]QBQ73169.1 hypothetical protein kac65v151_gp139 [Nodularia phage vB_NspS-kac65v151]QBQ73377.1 hypothetical protein kac65v161_gp139 [Nodularia phage vB_NspS-kac65v161]QBQ73583.1 hypothetical protein kac65v162_gp139 [Nodularia phage vB_NspS-kac65v162]